MGFVDVIRQTADPLGVTGFSGQSNPQTIVAVSQPATNTPTPTPAQASYDRVQSYLAAQSQKSFSEQLKGLSNSTVSAPPTFSQTEQGQKMIKLGIVAVIAWLFLFKGKW